MAPVSFRAVAACGLSAVLTLAGGCKKDEPAPAKTPEPAAPAVASTANPTHTIEGVSFTYPAGWQIMPGVSEREVGVQGPEDGSWQPSAYIVLLPESNKQSVDELMDDYRLLLARKQDFQSIRTQSKGEETDTPMIRADYQYTDDRQNVKLQAFVVFMQIGQRRIQVLANSGADTWAKYQPALEALLDSVKVAKP